MSLTLTNAILRLASRISSVLGPDATLRQINTLLHVAMSGTSGIDGTTLERKTESSQAAVSRNLKLLAIQHGLIEFFLDQTDGRRRLVRMTPKGAALLKKMTKEVE